MTEKRDRTVGEIVDQVMATIPGEVKILFQPALTSLMYTAPEAIDSWIYNKFLPTFNEVVSYPPKDEWEFNAVAVLMRKTTEEVKEMFGEMGTDD